MSSIGRNFLVFAVFLLQTKIIYSNENSTMPSSAAGPMAIVPNAGSGRLDQPLLIADPKSGESLAADEQPQLSDSLKSHISSPPQSPVEAVKIQPANPVADEDETEEEHSVDRRVPDFRSFWTLRANGFFPNATLKNRTGSGWGIGGSARANILKFLEPEISVDWLYASSIKNGQDNFLNLFPIGLGLRFNRSWKKWSAYASPELGGIFWLSGAKRILDRKKTSSHGFDFLGAASLGLLYEWKENSIFSLRYKLSYGAGYINQSYSSFGFEWSKRF